MQPTQVASPSYFHRVVDCQWACPAHTPVPEYIRLIGQGRYADAYMVNWASNVFPGILGRTCDRPCEPACRRGRVEESNQAQPEPVAICRLKRVAADMKGEVAGRLPRPGPRNGLRVACVGAGPAALTVARDLAPLGIRTVAIAPGTFLTLAYSSRMTDEQAQAHWGPMVPNPKRMGDPDEYALLAVQIVENDFLNGTTIRLDGAQRF